MKCAVSQAALRQRRALYYSVLQKVSQLQSAYMVDLLGPLCDGDHCDETLPDHRTLGMTDTNHISEAGTFYLAPFLCQAFSTQRIL